MRRFARTVLLWLIVLALPVQGLAAPLMLHCAESRGHAAHARVNPVAADHAAGAHHAGVPEGAAATSDHSCSACAACCAALALPPGPALPGAPGPGEARRAALATPVMPYLTDGLERPPRAWRA